MIARSRSAAVAAYLLLCIILGGSAQGAWGLLALELLGIGLIAWSALVSREQFSDFPVFPFALIVAALLVILIQVLPLPADVWARIPGRSAEAAAFTQLGMSPSALPISETPYESVMTLLAAIPAFATFLSVATMRPDLRWIAGAIAIGTVLSVLLGAVQVAGGPESGAYLYQITNKGAVGFFANHNHMATLLLVAIPMSTALVVLAKAGKRSGGRYGLGAVLLLLILGGIGLNGSLAALGLVVPVLLASLSLLPGSVGWRRLSLPLAVIALAAGIALIAINPIGIGANDADAMTSLNSRTEIWKTTAAAIHDSFPIGTGLGSFQQVYQLYEDPLQVTPLYVNHAHNDYLELTLELGLAGALLILLFLGWWVVMAIRIWRSQLGTSIARAATIATAAILAHSIVDFPLRTAAISAIFGGCVAIMAQSLRNTESKRGESRPTRHVTLG